MRFQRRMTLAGIAIVFTALYIFIGPDSSQLLANVRFSEDLFNEQNIKFNRLQEDKEIAEVIESRPPKTIIFYTKVPFEEMLAKWANNTYKDQKCKTNNCLVTTEKDKVYDVDCIWFRDSLKFPDFNPRSNQIVLLEICESPYMSGTFSHVQYKINWTSTYRRDSTHHNTYGRLTYHNSSIRYRTQTKNYALGKNKMAAMFVSNCHASNSRLDYANELANFIDVDIFGKCGNLSCPRNNTNACNKMLNTDYRFYLAFENANCLEYITEKFYYTGLQNDVLPVVMGAPPEDYARDAPFHSYIHVEDFDSPRHLADYLHKVAQNDTLYNTYFQWKGTVDIVQVIGQHFFCDICDMLNSNTIPQFPVSNIDTWWRPEGTCSGKELWTDYRKAKKIM